MDGRRIGDYVVEAKLGGGGMATVYRATHDILGTTHALKVLDEDLRKVEGARRRFLDEARIQAQHLDHPNIVKVINIVATSEAAALVMELIDGPSLAGHIAGLREPPSTSELCALALPILDAVQHAHDHGIIHRDLKPDNVLIATRNGALVPYVTDFGVAKVGDAACAASTSGPSGSYRGSIRRSRPRSTRRSTPTRRAGSRAAPSSRARCPVRRARTRSFRRPLRLRPAPRRAAHAPGSC